MSNAIILGSSGQIGTCVKDFLLNSGETVLGINRTQTTKDIETSIKNVFFRGNKHCTLYVCAGGFCERNLKSNSDTGQQFIETELKILHFIEDIKNVIKIDKCIYFSTARVYSPALQPIGVTQPLQRDLAYSDAKLAMEDGLRARFNEKLTVVRVFNNHGPKHFNRPFFLFKRLRAHLFDPGTEIIKDRVNIDCSWSEDLIAALLKSNFKNFTTVNCGSGKGVSLHHLDLTISRLVAQKEEEKFQQILLDFSLCTNSRNLSEPSFVCADEQGSIIAPQSTEKIIQAYLLKNKFRS